jgi:hypothetical protein
MGKPVSHHHLCIPLTSPRCKILTTLPLIRLGSDNSLCCPMQVLVVVRLVSSSITCSFPDCRQLEIGRKKHASLVWLAASCKLTPVMSQRHREQAIARAFANQDAIDMISDDDWDEYEARLLQGSSSSGTTLTPTPTSPKHKAQSPSKPSSSPPHKRKREEEEECTALPPDPGECAPKRPKRPRQGDEGKSGKPFKTVTKMEMGLRTDPAEQAVPPNEVEEDIIDVGVGVDVDGDDSSHSTHSVQTNQTQTDAGPSSRGECAIEPIAIVEIHASAALSRLSGSGSSSTTQRASKLAASVDDVRTSLPLPQSFNAQTPPPNPSSSSSSPPAAAGDDEGGVPPPAAMPKGKPAATATAAGAGAGGSKKPKPKLVRPEKKEKKKTKKELEAEKKALDLREKKMMRREFIQYLYEEKLKEELENAPLKRLVLKDKVIWYAEPGNAKASDSFDRRRYEMVCAPLRFAVCPAACSYILPSSSFAMGLPLCRISTTQQLPMSSSRAT